jgi:cyclopropane fatty-acyl-phospholipid synthase-like methyltransferase
VVVDPGWYLDELAHAGPEHLDEAYVAGYDRKAGPESGEDLALLRELGLGERHTLVDLGAGTGSLALAAAPFCRQVAAVDVSPAMRSVVRDRAERLGLRNLEVIQAGLLSYEHQGEPADFVYSRNVLHHLPDFWKAVALERVAEMMAAGGVLLLRDLVYSFDPAEADEAIEAWLAGATARSEEGWTRAELEEHLRQEYSTFSWLLEPMLERSGFAIRRAEHSANRIYAAYTCVKV